MSSPLLNPDDSPPVDVRSGRDRRLLLVCDHASNRVPHALDHLGLSDEVLSHHVAFDRGARQLTERLSERLDAPAVLGGFSRLVIDLNRDPSSYHSIPVESDGILVPGNQGLSRAQRAARRIELFDRYHWAVANALDDARADGVVPTVVNVHSFTPALSDGVHRPWQIGLLWRHDDRLVRLLQEHLHAEPGLAVGDNEPYSGHVHEGYTLPHHAEHPGLAHVLLEVRDDQLATDQGVAEWAERLSGALGSREADWWPTAEIRQPDGGHVMVDEPGLTVGVEEEFMLVDQDSGELLQEAPAELLAAFDDVMGPQVTTEFLQCQIEVGTKVCRSMAELTDELITLRSAVASVADEHGLALIASSTHPTAGRDAARRTRKERYRVLAEDLQEVVRRLVICGMHIHVGIDDEDLRLDFMSQTTYILPHLLALSTSSPFWRGKDTGLKSYRISVWDEMPRTGLPPNFASYGEYERHVDVLVQAGVIPDGTMIWWDLRPSWRFPTIEARICDVCTTVEDAVAITALLRCWVHMLWRLRRRNQRWRSYEPMLLNENRWRAQRYGTDNGMIDFGQGSIVGFPALIDEVIELLDEDADALGCRPELAHLRTILNRGTSAHRQLEVYRAALGGADDHEAGRAVIDWLRTETVASCR